MAPSTPTRPPQGFIAQVSSDGQITVQPDPNAPPNHLLLPPLINAHAHFELHAIGPQPYNASAGFLGWVTSLKESLPATQPDERASLAWYADSVHAASRASIEQGTLAIGDIHQLDQSAKLVAQSGLIGVSYQEVFGLGAPFDKHGLNQIASLPPQQNNLKRGIEPHAPYSAGQSLYQAACHTSHPVCTHLAETKEELAFVSSATGPFRDLLMQIGKWRPEFAESCNASLTPVQWMLPYLKQRPWLLAHGNYLTDQDIETLASLPDSSRASIAYCPVASDYFGHSNHRYAELIQAGINVCLGTDSILCQSPNQAQPYSIFEQMRHLYRRDQTSPHTLLRMATTNGAIALGNLSIDFTKPYASIAIDPASPTDPLTQALQSKQPLQRLS